MGQMIQKPDANPIIVALLNFFLFGAVGYLYMGQQKKGIISLVIALVGGLLTCGLVSTIWAFVSAYDGYLLGEKLQKGQPIGENENALPFLNNIFKD